MISPRNSGWLLQVQGLLNARSMPGAGVLRLVELFLPLGAAGQDNRRGLCLSAQPLHRPRQTLDQSVTPAQAGTASRAESTAQAALRPSLDRGFRRNDAPHSAIAAPRHKFRMLISGAGRSGSFGYSRWGASTFSIHFMNARTRRDRLRRCATTRDTASDRRAKSGRISTSAPLSKYWPIPRNGA